MLSRVMMIAGEASGDLHGAGVIRELRKRRPSVEIYGIGGDRMRSEGMELVEHISTVSFMGFVEVIRHLPKIRSMEKTLERLLVDRKPDVLVLIDYPGFNLRFARKAKRLGVDILYYISPQVWAWNKRRVKKMKGIVDQMKVVFPFEVEIYQQNGINVEFVGHPLVETIDSSSTREKFFETHGLEGARKLLALLPGSRKQEIENILPTMVSAALRLHEVHGVQLALGVAPSLDTDFLRQFIPSDAAITFVENGTYDLMRHADAAIVTSGTATLETGWFCTPMVVVYKTSPLTYLIGRLVIDVPNIGLVNIVAGKRVVPELIQHEMNVRNLVHEVGKILEDREYASAVRSALSVIKVKLGVPGASSRVADSIIALGEAA
jgi:lipid-A-disaccharide synthase